MTGDIHLKRIYAPRDSHDGLRVLIDRIWPRGVAKAEAGIDLWLKEVAPSTALRKWFGHRPARWPEFRSRYLAELARSPDADRLRALCGGGVVTLLYAAKDEAHNNAVVLAEHLRSGSRPAAALSPADAQLKARALGRWENEGGAVPGPLPLPGKPPKHPRRPAGGREGAG